MNLDYYFLFLSILGSGIFLKATCASTSDNTYLPEKATIGQGKLSIEPLSYRINGTNGTSSILFSSDKRVLHAFDDEYGGVIVDPERLPANPYAFVSILHASLSHWKKMVISLSF
jgi:hypothetical protein